MATISGVHRVLGPRSGGKMVRTRRTAVLKTPYDRPRVWISKLISVGGKLLSSVVGAESSSSSSASSSISASSSDDIDDNKNSDDEVSARGIDSMEMRETQSIMGKSETKYLIEQLLMEETFSREECDRLTSIIKSRVVRSPMIGHVETGRHDHDLCSAAVMEARKWFKEKSESNSKPELFHGNCVLNSFMLPNSIEGEVGSPVELAKSYMQTRPPRSSPSVNPIEYQSSPPTGVQLFKEGTPYSIGSSSQLKTDSLTSNSWNIMEELRKVRSKATEEMLRTLPSTKDPKSPDKNCLAFEEFSIIVGDAHVGNGCPPSGFSLTPLPDKEQIHKSMDGGESMVGSERTNAAADETCEPLFESSIEVDIVSKSEGIASDFRNSYSMHYEGSSHKLDQPTLKDNLTGKNHGGEKQWGKKMSGYRRGRRRNRQC